MDELDSYFAFIEITGGPCICQRFLENGVQVIRSITGEEFLSIVGTFNITSVGTVNMASRCMKMHPVRTKYLHRGFWPGEDVPDTLNLFSGFAYDRTRAANPEACAPLINHIVKVWCREEEAAATYVLNWMAHIMQNPETKTGVALVISGREGCGKGLVVQKLIQVIGQRHCYQTANIGDICSFNEYALVDSLLLFLDEAVCTSDRASRGKLYSVITEEKILYEKKYGTRWVGPNRTNVIMCSNHDHVANIDGAGRRFMVLEADPAHAYNFDAGRIAENQRYHEAIVNVPPESFAAFLWNRDITGFSPRAVPYTKYLAQQQALSVDPKLQWLIKCIDDDRILLPKEIGGWNRVQADNEHESATPDDPDFGGCMLSVDACVESFWATAGTRRHFVSPSNFFVYINRVMNGKVRFKRLPPPCSGLYARFPLLEHAKIYIANFLGRETYDFGVLGMAT